MKINQVNIERSQTQLQSKDAVQKNRPTEAIVNQESESVQSSDEIFVKEVMSEEMLQRSIEQANKTLEIYNRHIDREVHEVTKTVIYTMKDTETGEVIKEFPPRKIQDMIAKMWELAGLFVDERA